MKNIIRYAGLTVLVWFASMPILASEKDYRLKVDVSVQAESSLKNRIESCVGKELRALGDVILVEDEPDFSLVIVALYAKTKAGETRGVALSVTTLVPYDSDGPSKVFEGQYRTLYVLGTRDLIHYKGTELLLTSEEDLPITCSGIVADFDINHLKEQRKKNLEELRLQESIDKLIDGVEKKKKSG